MLKYIPKYFYNNGVPYIWQWFLLLIYAIPVALIFITNQTLYHVSTTVLLALVILAFGYHSTRKRLSLKIWGSYFLGCIFLNTSLIFSEFSYFGLDVNLQVLFWIEQFGIILVTIFAFTIMTLFEKKLRLNGLTTDFTLLALSIVSLVLLTTPDLLNNFLLMNFVDQLLIIKLLVSFIILTMIFLLHLLTRKIILHNIVLAITVLFIISHFGIDLLNRLNYTQIDQRFSLSLYVLAGTTAILFAFIENISTTYYPSKNSDALGSTLMWIASITGLTTIPVGIFVRWYQQYQPIQVIYIGIFSFILSSIVIWRIVSLIKNTRHQDNRLRKIAYTDPVTFLPNYHGLIEKIESKPLETKNILIVAINIDDFRSINDLYGRSFGDDVLISLSKRLQNLPKLTTASRVGTDLFITVFQLEKKEIQELIKSIQTKLGIWDMISGHRVAVPLTFGISYSKNLDNPQQLIQQAEEALFNARVQNIAYSIFNKSSNKNIPRHIIRETLQKAIDQNFLPIHFQPIYNINDGSLKALEVLIRVQSNENKILYPGQFLEQAQAYGLLMTLTKICISMIAKNYQKLPNVIININLPSYMLENEKIFNDFLHCFNVAKLPKNRFCLEILEDQDIPADRLVESITKLKEKGFSIAMDDFGTGFSSLSRLSILPFDTVKIDRSLLLAASSGNKTILESAITLIKRLKLSTVVEGVETIEQLNLIRQLGADSVQGFLLSRPVDINKAKDLPLNAANILPEF